MCGGPRYISQGIPWNGHLFWSTFVLGGVNVTFPGIGLSRGVPLSLLWVCTLGPKRGGMFRWSW